MDIEIIKKGMKQNRFDSYVGFWAGKLNDNIKSEKNICLFNIFCVEILLPYFKRYGNVGFDIDYILDVCKKNLENTIFNDEIYNNLRKLDDIQDNYNDDYTLIFSRCSSMLRPCAFYSGVDRKRIRKGTIKTSILSIVECLNRLSVVFLMGESALKKEIKTSIFKMFEYGILLSENERNKHGSLQSQCKQG